VNTAGNAPAQLSTAGGSPVTGGGSDLEPPDAPPPVVSPPARAWFGAPPAPGLELPPFEGLLGEPPRGELEEPPSPSLGRPAEAPEALFFLGFETGSSEHAERVPSAKPRTAPPTPNVRLCWIRDICPGSGDLGAESLGKRQAVRPIGYLTNAGGGKL